MHTSSDSGKALFQSFQLKSVEQSWQSWTSRNLMLPWFALVGNKWPTGLGIWKQCNARSRTRLACSWFGTPPLWIYTMTTRCPTVWWAAENTQPCVHMSYKPIMQQTCRLKGKHAHVLRHWQGFISIFPVQISWTVMTVMNKSEPDASMVCPCWPQVTHRARNMEAVQCKEQDSTCLQLVWEATTVDIHHDNKMPNSMVGCWEYTAMRPPVLVFPAKMIHHSNSSLNALVCRTDKENPRHVAIANVYIYFQGSLTCDHCKRSLMGVRQFQL